MIGNGDIRDNVKVYVSPISNVVPLVVVDDIVFATFPTLADRSTRTSVVKGPFFEIAAGSSLGMRLRRQIEKMTADLYFLHPSFFEQEESDFRNLLHARLLV